MPQISNKQTSTATRIDHATRTLVYVKRHWSDDWSLAKRSAPPSKVELRIAARDGKPPHKGKIPIIDGVIRAEGWDQYTWPSIGTAALKCVSGELGMLEDESAYRLIRPEDLVGWYVKIVELVEKPRAPLNSPAPGPDPVTIAEEPAWVGMFTERMFDLTPDAPSDGAQRPAPRYGETSIVAHELSFLLTRHFLNKSWWEAPGDNMVATDAVPPLNRPWDRDVAGVGNRSVDRAVWTDSYVFGEGARWSVYDFLEYALANHIGGAPAAAAQQASGTNLAHRIVPDFVLTGPAAEDLKHIEAAGRFEGKSLFAIIEELLPRNKGFGLRVVTDGEPDSQVELCVYSQLDSGLKGPGNRQITANKSAMTIKLDDDESFDGVVLRSSAATQFDTIEVRGAPITVTATFGHADGTAEAGWDEELADTCLLATEETGELPEGMTRPQVDDEFRQADIFRAVFSLLQVPAEWRHDPKTADGRAGVALNDKTFYAFLPELDEQGLFQSGDDGDVVGTSLATPFAKFEQLTALLADVDYTAHDWGTSGPTVPDGAKPDRVPLIAWVGHPVTQGGDVDGRYYAPLELIPKAIAGGDRDEGVDVYPLQHGLGIRIEPSIRHLFSHDECAIFSTGISSEQYPLPAMSWKNIGWTGTVITDRHLVVRDYITSVGDDCGRIKVINVPHARFDYCPPGTVVGVKGGKLLTLPASNHVLRDDSELLRWIAKLAREYYGKPRYTVQLRRRDPRKRPTVGTMLATVSSASQLQAINTVVTAVRVSYAEGNEGVTIETGANELDFA